MRRSTHLAVASLAAIAAAVGAAVPATALSQHSRGDHGDHGRAGHHSIKTSPYVALGDSYASGAGVAPFVVGSPPTCSRSTLNFAHDIAAVTKPRDFTDVTCSGAKTADFYGSQATGVAPQLDAVTKKTRFVTMTIGGNDEDVFTSSFFGCATISASDVLGNPCERKYGTTFTDAIRTQTYPNVVKAIRAVQAKAPHATVAILGYPQILPEVGRLSCYPVMPISMGDVPWLKHEQDVLNDVIAKAAKQTGARFVDMAPSSTGHDACAPVGTRWIEPAVGPVNAYPVHPNATGEAAMARQTLQQLRLEVGRR